MHLRIYFFSFALSVALPVNAQTTTCAIAGDAKSWASDACLWQNETDDINTASVKLCMQHAQNQIKQLGECEAKYLFKSTICAYAANWDIDEKCIQSRAPLGPTLQARQSL